MRPRKLLYALMGAGLTCFAVRSVQATSLTQEIDTLFGPSGITIQAATHQAHFSSDSLSTLGSLAGQLASNASDFPAISTAPSFSYRYNPDIKVFERTPGSLGPVFVDRVQTVGQGRFDVGASYLFIDFAKLNGDDLDHLSFLLHHEATQPPAAFNADTVALNFQRFTLRSHVMSFFATYGLTDRWDVNALVPVVYTSLDLRALATINNTSGPIHKFGPGQTCVVTDPSGLQCEARTDDDKFGVGDILLRTKYRFAEFLAGGLALRVPTGNSDDFQGSGDVAVTPTLIASHEFELPWPALRGALRGPHDVHANVGIETDVENIDRSRARYAAGISAQLNDYVALLVDLLGSSGLTHQKASTTVPVFDNNIPPATTLPVGFERVSTSIRTDIIDLAVGFKVHILSNTLAFASAIVPLNNDGIRADVIPAGGIEVSF